MASCCESFRAPHDVQAPLEMLGARLLARVVPSDRETSRRLELGGRDVMGDMTMSRVLAGREKPSRGDSKMRDLSPELLELAALLADFWLLPP